MLLFFVVDKIFFTVEKIFFFDAKLLCVLII